MGDAAFGPGIEFDLIRQLRERWGALAVGIGDDASVLQPPAGEQIVLSTDAALENVHFRRDWLSLREIGYRSITAALSDLAAMAATPRGVLVSLELTSEARDRLMDLADGIADAVRAVDSVILGGNLVRGDSLGITTTVVGSAASPLTRKGARPGGSLYVTGLLGGTAAAVAALRAHQTLAPALRERFARPAARIGEARWLAAHGAVAGIDISDGLAGDAAHLAAASGMTLEIQVERVPIITGATTEQAIAGGEEFELLVVAPGSLPHEEFAKRFKLPLTQIGLVREGPPEAVFMHDGKRVATPHGYDHFSR